MHSKSSTATLPDENRSTSAWHEDGTSNRWKLRHCSSNHPHSRLSTLYTPLGGRSDQWTYREGYLVKTLEVSCTGENAPTPDGWRKTDEQLPDEQDRTGDNTEDFIESSFSAKSLKDMRGEEKSGSWSSLEFQGQDQQHQQLTQQKNRWPLLTKEQVSQRRPQSQQKS